VPLRLPRRRAARLGAIRPHRQSAQSWDVSEPHGPRPQHPPIRDMDKSTACGPVGYRVDRTEGQDVVSSVLTQPSRAHVRVTANPVLSRLMGPGVTAMSRLAGCEGRKSASARDLFCSGERLRAPSVSSRSTAAHISLTAALRSGNSASDLGISRSAAVTLRCGRRIGACVPPVENASLNRGSGRKNDL
jgi:hypothetical protein